MDPTTSKTSIAQKIKSKQSAHSIKFGSPNLRDLLRQKCKIRIRESRCNTFNNQRVLFGSGSEKDFVNDVIKEELKELYFDIDSMDCIYQELIDDLKQWCSDKLIDADTNFLSSFFDDSLNLFFCPVCQIAVLNSAIGCAFCNACKLKFRCDKPIDQFHYNIKRKLVEHENICDHKIIFFAEPIADSAGLSMLNLFCHSCDFYAALN